jgi:hypothetical protein
MHVTHTGQEVTVAYAERTIFQDVTPGRQVRAVRVGLTDSWWIRLTSFWI